jgi:toxin-antitoxin system PIN domain toxin
VLVFDTNVLLYAADEDSEHHEPCRSRIEDARRSPSPAFLTWNICYEFLRVTTHRRILPNHWTLAEGLQFLDRLLTSPGFTLLLPTEKHLTTLSEVAGEVSVIRGNRVHDMHTAVLMREHGISQICTMDSDFRRFPFVEVIDPTQ